MGATALLVPFAQEALRLRTAFASLTPLNTPASTKQEVFIPLEVGSTAYCEKPAQAQT